MKDLYGKKPVAKVNRAMRTNRFAATNRDGETFDDMVEVHAMEMEILKRGGQDR